MSSKAVEPTGPVIVINLVSLDGETIRLIDKSWQGSGPLHSCLCQGL